jgi:hypothetical protein
MQGTFVPHKTPPVCPGPQTPPLKNRFTSDEAALACSAYRADQEMGSASHRYQVEAPGRDTAALIGAVVTSSILILKIRYFQYYAHK